MRLTHPSALLWLLLALPLIAFYLLKVRRRRVPVSTIQFWDQVFGDRRPRALWQRLRHPLSLLLQLLLLLLVTTALTDPRLTSQSLQGRRLVLVLDNSASMQATDVAPNRWTWAERQARQIIHGLRPQDQMAIISAGSTPRVEVGWTDHARTLLQTLDRVALTDGPTRIAEAVQLAQRLLQGKPSPQILLVGDQAFGGAAAAGNIPLEAITCGSEAANVAITHWQARRSLIDPLGLHALIEVGNFSRQPVACRLSVSLDDQLLDVIPLQLEPEQTWTQVLSYAVQGGGRLTAELNAADALACDNRAVALVPARAPQPVTLITPGNLFLESALRSLPAVELTVTGQWPRELQPESIVICHKSPLAPGNRPRNLLVVDPQDGGELWQRGDPLGDTLIVEQSAASALMSHVQILHLPISGVRQMQLGDDYQVLAKAPGDVPVLAARSDAQGKILIWNATLDEGDLPLRTAFPILISNAIQWFAGDPGSWREAYATGTAATVTADVTRNASAQPAVATDVGADYHLVRPDGSTTPLARPAPDWTIGPLDQAGVWRVERHIAAAVDADAGAGTRVTVAEVACNLASRSESDVRVAPSAIRDVAGPGSGGWPLWILLTLLGLLLSATEWFLYQRRWVG